mgnify:FL=1
MKKKTNYLNEIEQNFQSSIRKYNLNYQSNHWLYNNKKKIKLFNKKNLKSFRANGLSEGMDDKYYSKKQSIKLLNSLIKECGKDFIYKTLLKKNIGKSNKALKFKSYYYTAHELFHIKFIHEVKKKIKIKKNDIICEIGPAYGSMIGKLIKLYNAKAILIDLPEANFMSHYYLKKIFPKKKFFVSDNIKNNQITKKNLIENDIIILCPWDKLPKVKINFFINVRSMMEMKYETINEYFQMIQNSIVNSGYFLCINRYYKDTVGYPIEMSKYPYDKLWKVLTSKTSWMQNHIHFLLTKRTKKPNLSVAEELSKIKKISRKVRLNDKFALRRILPNFIYIIYKKTKFFLLGR